MNDRIDVICDLLLGAACADGTFEDRERTAIRELLGNLLGGEIPEGLERRIQLFDPEGFDVAEAAGAFAGDPDADKTKLLELIAVVHEADEEFDFAEDDYMLAVAKTLKVSDDTLKQFKLEYEIEDLKQDVDKLRAAPGSPPPS